MKFYFNTDNDSYEPDPEGTELASIDQARRETIQLASELLVNGKGDALLTGGSATHSGALAVPEHAKRLPGSARANAQRILTSGVSLASPKPFIPRKFFLL